MAKYLPQFDIAANQGGSSIWVRGPKGLDSRKLSQACLKKDVIIEPGHVHYAHQERPHNRFRLGYTSIRLENIEAGVKNIAECVSLLKV